MVLDSHSTKSPSRSTGTSALGLSARNSGVCVGLKPLPHSSCSYGRPSSVHSHSTLRTLIDVERPRICSMVAAFCSSTDQSNTPVQHLALRGVAPPGRRRPAAHEIGDGHE